MYGIDDWWLFCWIEHPTDSEAIRVCMQLTAPAQV